MADGGRSSLPPGRAPRKRSTRPARRVETYYNNGVLFAATKVHPSPLNLFGRTWTKMKSGALGVSKGVGVIVCIGNL